MFETLFSETQNQNYPSALYMVATPLGNRADITIRALYVLTLVDAIFCEDTRNTQRLLSSYGINKPLFAAHEHNEHEAAQKIIARLSHGEKVAYVTDAGTPGVSDPGARIANDILEAKLKVIPIPGPSAVATALSASAHPTTSFYFVGFLAPKKGAKEEQLKEIASYRVPLLFYEAPHRIKETLKTLLQLLGNRKITLAREMTKLFEEFHTCSLSDAISWIEKDKHRESGEYVLIVEGASETKTDSNRVLEILLNELPVSQAASLAAQITGEKKKTLYEKALLMKKN